METISKFWDRLIQELVPMVDWGMRHWALSIVILAVLIYWAGRQRRMDRNKL